MTFKMVELNSLQIKQTKELSFFNNANNISKVSSPAINFIYDYKWEDLWEWKVQSDIILYRNNKCIQPLDITLVRKNNANKTTLQPEISSESTLFPSRVNQICWMVSGRS